MMETAMPGAEGTRRGASPQGVIVLVGKAHLCSTRVDARKDGLFFSHTSSFTMDHVDVIDDVHDATLQDLLRGLRGRRVRVTVEEVE
jgi:hypothetical protein